MAGSAIVRRLRQDAYHVLVAERSELDVTRQDQTEGYFPTIRPVVVIMAAGRVGGILANDKYPANFLAENLAMALNCIQASHLVERDAHAPPSHDDPIGVCYRSARQNCGSKASSAPCPSPTDWQSNGRPDINGHWLI
jgi:NAD dependent epimerase/dehydratase family